MLICIPYAVVHQPNGKAGGRAGGLGYNRRVVLTLVDLRGYSGDPLERLPRAVLDRDAARESVRALVRDVRERGDAAVAEASKRFGGSAEPRRVPASEIAAARARSPAGLVPALEAA